MKIAAVKNPRDLDERAQGAVSQLNPIDSEIHGLLSPAQIAHYPEELHAKKVGRLALDRVSRYPYEAMERKNGRPRKLLQLIQRQAGISRRKAQELIAEGEVSIDGEVATDPFLMVDPERIRLLTLRGHPLSLFEPEERIYRYYKPRGVLCSHDDPFYGNTVGRVLRTEGFIGYTWVGRLDQDAEGLLLLTNAGDVVHAFTHPRYGVKKVYRVWVRTLPPRGRLNAILAEMRRGIVDDGDSLRAISAETKGGYVEVTLAEGKKHEIKRLFSHFSLEVKRLLRVAIGPVTLGDLKPGEFSRLSEEDTKKVLAIVNERLDRFRG